MGFCLADMDAPNTGATIFAPGSNLEEESLLIPKGSMHPERYVLKDQRSAEVGSPNCLRGPSHGRVSL